MELHPGFGFMSKPKLVWNGSTLKTVSKNCMSVKTIFGFQEHKQSDDVKLGEKEEQQKNLV